MSMATWDSLYRAACAEMDREKAVLDVDLMDTPQMWIMRAKMKYGGRLTESGEIYEEADYIRAARQMQLEAQANK